MGRRRQDRNCRLGKGAKTGTTMSDKKETQPSEEKTPKGYIRDGIKQQKNTTKADEKPSDVKAQEQSPSLADDHPNQYNQATGETSNSRIERPAKDTPGSFHEKDCNLVPSPVKHELNKTESTVIGKQGQSEATGDNTEETASVIEEQDRKERICIEDKKLDSQGNDSFARVSSRSKHLDETANNQSSSNTEQILAAGTIEKTPDIRGGEMRLCESTSTEAQEHHSEMNKSHKTNNDVLPSLSEPQQKSDESSKYQESQLKQKTREPASSLTCVESNTAGSEKHNKTSSAAISDHTNVDDELECTETNKPNKIQPMPEDQQGNRCVGHNSNNDETGDVDQKNSGFSEKPNESLNDTREPGGNLTCVKSNPAGSEDRNKASSTDVSVHTNGDDELESREIQPLKSNESNKDQYMPEGKQENRSVGPHSNDDERGKEPWEDGMQHMSNNKTCSSPKESIHFNQTKPITNGTQCNVSEAVHSEEMMESTSNIEPTNENIHSRQLSQNDNGKPGLNRNTNALKPSYNKDVLPQFDDMVNGNGDSFESHKEDTGLTSQLSNREYGHGCSELMTMEIQSHRGQDKTVNVKQIDNLLTKVNALVMPFEDEIDWKYSQLEQVKTELRLLKEYIYDTHKKGEQKDEVIEKLQKEFKHLDNIMNTKEAELVHYKEKSKELIDKINRLTWSLNAEKRQVNDLNNMLVTIKDEQEQYKTDLSKATESNLQTQRKLEELEKSHEAEIQLRKDTEKKLNEYEKRFTLEQELPDLQQTLAGKMKELNDIANMIDARSADLHEIRCKKPMKQEMKQLADKILEKDNLLQELDTEIENLKSEILVKNLQMDSKAREIEDLQRSLEQTENRILKQERKNQSMKNDLSTIKTSLNAKDEQLKHCNSRIKYLREIIEEKQTKRKTQLKKYLLKLKESFTDKAGRSRKQTEELERIISMLQSFEWKSQIEHSITDLEEMLESTDTSNTDDTHAKTVQDIIALIQELLENQIGEDKELETASSIPDGRQNICDECHKHQLEIRRFQVKLREVEEKNEALTSELVSLQLRVNNPNIIDLKDQFRPKKLAEMFNELYDNEWTSVFDCLVCNYNEDFIIKILLDILMDLHSLCKTRFAVAWTVVGEWFLDEKFQGFQHIRKALLEFGKMKVWDLVPAVKQMFLQQLMGQCSDRKKMILTEYSMGNFIEACTRLCLLMAANDPPVVFYCPGWTPKTAHQDEVDDLSRRFKSIPVKPATPGRASQATMLREPKLLLENGSRSNNANAPFSPGHQSAKYMARQPVQSTDSWRESSTECVDSSDDEERKSIYRRLRRSKIKRKRQALDKNFFKEYTRQGPYIEYIVWPVMLLHEQGPILSKGVAQGTKDKHSYVEVNPMTY